MSTRGTGDPPSLEALEAWMLSLIAAARGGAEHEGPSARVPDWICPSRALSSRQRLEIYTGMYWARLHECLEQDHPGVRAVLGPDAFRRLAREFIARHPPRHFTLNLYGQEFCEFLGHEAAEVPARELVRDLARLERALVDVFHEREEAPLRAGELQELPEEAFAGAVLHPVAACRWFAFSYPVSSALDALRSGGSDALPGAQREHVMVLRRRQRVERHSLETDEYEVLDHLGHGRTLESALARLATKGPEATALETRVAGWFRRWMELGVFSRMELRDP